MIETIFLLPLSFVATIALTIFMRHYSIKIGMIDVPNTRSSHTINTPRGGGISIIIVYLLSIGYLWISNDSFDTNLIKGIIGGGVIVALIGFWDDRHDVPAKWRILIHFIASTLALSLITELPSISIFHFTLKSSLFMFFVMSIALVWMLNLYNFMDGTDGIASIEAITVLLGAVLILYLQGNTEVSIFLLLLSTCVSGFLIFNWSPAKIFMGDSCSGFLGITIGLIAISTSSSEQQFINLWSWFILLAVFIIDASFTLIYRIIKKNQWSKAHRSHTYQILSRQYNSHAKIASGVIIINIFWLFPLAFLASIYKFWAPILATIAVIPLLLFAYKSGAGINND